MEVGLFVILDQWRAGGNGSDGEGEVRLGGGVKIEFCPGAPETA
jgi:hypothetical protein